jgi:hypothetical protein
MASQPFPPRQSSAYALAIANLQQLILARREARKGPACGKGPGVAVPKLPDGNHGENNFTGDKT